MRAFFTRPLVLAILSGILIGTSYIPFPPWAIFFCLIPLWLCWLENPNYKKIFWTGWITQFVLTLIGFNWVSYTVHEFGHLPWWAAILTLFAFCAFANLYVPLSGLVWLFVTRRLQLQPFAQVLALPIFFSIAERLFPMIFDWNFGYTWLWAGFPAFHLADVIGFIGLSNIGVFFNAALLWAYLEGKARRPWRAWPLSVLGLFLLMNAIGFWHGQRVQTADQMTKMLVVQANIGNQEKLMSDYGWAYRDKVMERFRSNTLEGLTQFPDTDYVVWPETAFPEIVSDPELLQGYAQNLKRLITMSKTKFLIGGYSRLIQNGRITNSFFAIDENGRWLSEPYHKTVLLAFGEYLPGGEWFPQLYSLLPQVGRFGRGPGPSVVETGGIQVGVQICYEGLFDWFTRELARKGAQVIVNVTNDSWYGTWQQPYQHLYMTLARAVEVRRPLVRSTNTGISSAILADGKILTPSPLQQEWFHLYEIPYSSNPKATIFMSWGFWLIPALLAFLILGMIWNRRTRKT